MRGERAEPVVVGVKRARAKYEQARKTRILHLNSLFLRLVPQVMRRGRGGGGSWPSGFVGGWTQGEVAQGSEAKGEADWGLRRTSLSASTRICAGRVVAGCFPGASGPRLQQPASTAAGGGLAAGAGAALDQRQPGPRGALSGASSVQKAAGEEPPSPRRPSS